MRLGVAVSVGDIGGEPRAIRNLQELVGKTVDAGGRRPGFPEG